MSNSPAEKEADAQTNSEPQPKRRCGGCFVLRALLILLTACVVLLATLWASAALYYDIPVAWLRIPLAVLFLSALFFVWVRRRAVWQKLILHLLLFIGVLGWWLTLKPSNNRDWQPDVAVLAYAELDGDKITVRNVRNCEYKTETEYEPRYYDKTYNLDRLQSADIFLVYWGSPAIAHMMVSFGFDGGDYLCFSIETREEKGEGYSAVKGFFRQFEVFYVAADERDLVRLRTNFRNGEDVYLYRIATTPEKVRQLFMGYIRRMNQLRNYPEWYNAVSRNCATSIRMQRTASERAPWDWRMLANGYSDTLMYERGAIVTNVPFAELKEKGHVNARAKAAGDSENFSKAIRKGVPGIAE